MPGSTVTVVSPTATMRSRCSVDRSTPSAAESPTRLNEWRVPSGRIAWAAAINSCASSIDLGCTICVAAYVTLPAQFFTMAARISRFLDWHEREEAGDHEREQRR